MTQNQEFRSFPCAHKGCKAVVLEGYGYCGAHGGQGRLLREFRARERQARELLSPRERRELARPEPRKTEPRRRPQWDDRGAPVGTGLRGLAKRDAQRLRSEASAKECPPKQAAEPVATTAANQ